MVDSTVIVAQRGERVSAGPVYGTLRATLEVARYLIREGRRVTLVIGSNQATGEIDGIPFRGAMDDRDVAKALEACQPIETLMGISRADIFRMGDSRRRLVYHHGPHPIQEECAGEGACYSALNRAGIHIVCPSSSSRVEQISLGACPRMTHVVWNAFDHRVFHRAHTERRRPHSLVFVGHVVPYKGVDIVLGAFGLLRKEFPDATCTIVGKQLSWSDRGENLLAAGWLDTDHLLKWPVIERDIPGVHYEGEAAPSCLADVYREHSLLVMASRVAETFGIVSLEAQACGCLPVLPRKGGCPETIREGVTGHLYDELSPAELARVVAALWREGRPTAEERNAAGTWVTDTFSWEKTGRAFADIMATIPVSRRDVRGSLHRARYLQRVRTRWTGIGCDMWWTLMRWTKIPRHALGLRRNRWDNRGQRVS